MKTITIRIGETKQEPETKVQVAAQEKFKMISTAQTEDARYQAIYDSFSAIANDTQEDPNVLLETASSILAGLRSAITDSKPLTSFGLSPSSLAGVVAGIEYLVQSIPQMTDEKRTRAMKVLGNMTLGSNMTLNLIQAVANLAEKNPEWKTIERQLTKYADDGIVDNKLIERLSNIMVGVDRTIRAATTTNTAQLQRPAFA